MVLMRQILVCYSRQSGAMRKTRAKMYHTPTAKCSKIFGIKICNATICVYGVAFGGFFEILTFAVVLAQREASEGCVSHKT